jgi:hypothetical protein
MPDLATHFLIVSFLRKKQRDLSLVCLGTALPDLLSRPFLKLFPDLYWFVLPFHTVFGILIINYLFSLFFEEGKQKKVFVNLTIGGGVHLLLDSFQKSLGGPRGYYFLFPFWDKKISWGLFWPETSVFFLPFLLAIVVLWTIFPQKEKFFRKIKK